MAGGAVRKSFVEKYRDALLFNKNLIIAATCSLILSTGVSQLYSAFEASKLYNSIVALIADYGVYLPIFGYLYYHDNRQKYVDRQGQRNRKQIWADLRKLLAAFSVAEVIYAVARVLSQYQFLTVYRMQPYEASIAGELVAWIVFFLSINLMTGVVRLFRAKN